MHTTDADALYREGRLDEAIEALGVALRADPTDVRRRSFLFELLCFTGDYARAERQLEVLGQGGREAEMGTLFYRGVLQAERTRQDMFANGGLPPATPSGPVSGTLNGRRFASLSDADPRLGDRLEMFVAGRYVSIPLAQLASLRMAAPARLRDLLWAPAMVRAGPGFGGAELGEVLIPALAPLTWRHPEGSVRLGRLTDWEEADGAEVPVGQKLLLVDGEEMPILEVRELDVDAPAPSTA
jgi:type VI secretion system protein ImpE